MTVAEEFAETLLRQLGDDLRQEADEQCKTAIEYRDCHLHRQADTHSATARGLSQAAQMAYDRARALHGRATY